MKRDTFLKITSAALVALYLPDLQCHPKDKAFIQSLAMPKVLQHLCDERTIRQIGETYRKQFSDEKSEDVIVQLLSPNAKGLHISASENNKAVASLLQHKTNQDFIHNETVIIDGWILSRTEARQCALYSLIQKL